MKKILRRLKNDENCVGRAASLEKLLFRACFIFFILLVSIQIILVIPSVRSRLNIADKSLGVPLGNDEYLYDRGVVTLTMISENPDPAVKILVNGEVVSAFENIKIPVNVNEGDVIEIDGSSSPWSHIIKVENVTPNIDDRCLNACVNVDSKISKLLKVQFK